MRFQVLIYDDELPKPRWVPMTFRWEGENFDSKTGAIIDREIYRAQMGVVQPIPIKFTESKDGAMVAKKQAETNGWKAKIIEA